jgi:hypothetical protein
LRTADFELQKSLYQDYENKVKKQFAGKLMAFKNEEASRTGT